MRSGVWNAVAAAFAVVCFSIAGFVLGRATAPTAMPGPPAPAPGQPAALPVAEPVPAPEPMTAERLWALNPTADQLIREPDMMRLLLVGAPSAADRDAQRAWPGAIDYSVLNRNPRRQMRTDGTYNGRVAQIMEADNGATVLRVAMRAYGQNMIYVVTPDPVGPNIRERGRVKVFGRILGGHTYVSQAGHNITLPAIVASAIVPR